MSQTNVDNFISELGAGVLSEKLSHILSSVALGTVLHGQKKSGKVTLEFTFSQTDAESEQVKISHKIGHATPTKRGKKTEEDTTSTVFFVGKGGELTIDAPNEERTGQKNVALVLKMQKDGVQAN
jgi:hypothetical protein